MRGMISNSKWTPAEADSKAWALSLSNLGSWADLCLDEDGGLVVVVGADAEELREARVSRVVTYFEGERV